MAWQDDIDLDVYISTAGDYVSAGTTTQYPYEPGGSNAPAGWTAYPGGGGNMSDVNVTVSGGRYSISNIGPDDHMAKYYGAYRDFPTKANHTYLIQVNARTMDGKQGRTFNNTFFMWPPYTTHYGIVFPNTSDWSNVSLPITAPSTDSTVRVVTQFDYYPFADETRGPDWGAQWTNFAMVEVPPTIPDPTWLDVSCDVKGLSLRYGRERFTNRYEVATCGITLLNMTGKYSYRPDRPLRPGRFVKVVIREKRYGNTYPQFYGIIDSIKDGYTLDGKIATVLTCVDISSLLSNQTVPTVTSDSTYYNSGTRFYWLGRSAGWPASTISRETGKYIQQPILANGRSIRDELGLIADSEGGFFYSDRTGRIVFKDRTWPTRDYNQTHVTAELLAQPHTGETLPVIDQWPNADPPFPIVCTNEMETDWSRDRVVNEVSIANAGGSALVVRDPASQAKYGPRTYQRMDFLNSNSYPEYLTERANDIMTGYTEAVQRVNRIRWNAGHGNFDLNWFSFNLFLNWLVRVRYTHPENGWGFSVVARVQGYEHSWSLDEWTVGVFLDDIESFNYWDKPFEPIGWDVSQWDVGRWDDNAGSGAYWDRGYKWAPTNTGDETNVAKWGY